MDGTNKRLDDKWFDINFLEMYTRSCLKTFGYFDEILIVKKRTEILKNVLEKQYLSTNDYAEEFFQLNTTLECIKEYIKHNLVIEKEPISICIMVKNEERCIKRCIDSIEKIAKEIIIIDTGSTDNTISIIEEYANDKIKVFSKEWRNDFSEIRNYAIEKASSEWLVFIDADEY
ncbi:glycosyltransferase, partial [Listeria innocua]|nr:glycosyltransferase [Listeria innocua]